MLRSSTIGSFFGALPGTGPSIASFVSYAVEKRVSKTPERFGKGAVEGVVAPETAIPLLPQRLMTKCAVHSSRATLKE